jgi:hypothetical protein
VSAAASAASTASGPWARGQDRGADRAGPPACTAGVAQWVAEPVPPGPVLGDVHCGGAERQMRRVLAARLVAAVADHHIGCEQAFGAQSVRENHMRRGYLHGHAGGPAAVW